MKATLSILIISLNFLSAQSEFDSYLSVERFSFDVNSTYYFNSWDNYNDVVDLWARQISLETTFYEPRGQYDRIKGDLLSQLGIGYRINHNLTIYITGQYGNLEAGFETYPDFSNQPENRYTSHAYRQNIKFNLFSVGMNFQYKYPVNDFVSIYGAIGLDSYISEMLIENNNYYWSSGRLDDEPYATFNLKDESIGYEFYLGGEVNVIGPFLLTASIVYRDLNFDNMQGTGSNIYGNEYEAELAEASNYFGPRIPETTGNVRHDFYLEVFDTEPYQDETAKNSKKAQIDMSSFGLQFGIKIEL